MNTLRVMDRWKRKAAAVSLVVAAGIGVTACGDQQFAVYPNLGRVHFEGDDAKLQECFTTAPQGKGDVYILDFTVPFRLEKKSPDSSAGAFGSTQILDNPSFSALLAGLDSGRAGTYYTFDGTYENTTNKVSVACTEDLGNHIPNSLDGQVAQARRSPNNIKVLNGIVGPINTTTEIANDGTMVTNGHPVLQLAVPF